MNLNILHIRKRLSWVLHGDSINAIESYCGVLLSEVRQIEGVATQEAQMRGWNLNENEDLIQGMLKSERSAQRDADRELKATHHAARMVELAGEASEVLDGITSWSRQDCTIFFCIFFWRARVCRPLLG
jgi:hypothetical protein